MLPAVRPRAATLMDPAVGPAPPVARPPVVGSTTRPTADAISPRSRELPEGRRARFELHPGLVIPESRCRILRWIADGGMGVVYEAVHEELDRHVALKVLRPEYSDRQDLAQQFREEARSATRIGSDHIVQVFDFGALPDGRLFFTMELLAGARLSDSVGTLAIDRLFVVLRQMCRGLAAAHDTGIIHRDLKPDNVMLTAKDGRADFVKILDFGLVTMLGVDDGAKSTAGTPWYMAPELVLGEGFDHRVDIYAVGCTAFELLTGQPPFDDADPRAVLLAQLERPAPRPSTRTERAIPPALERVILRCLEKNPAARYQDMRELEVALVEAQLDARVYTTWDDLPLPRMDAPRRAELEAGLRAGGRVRPARRRPWLFPALGVGTLAGALAVGAAWWRSDSAPHDGGRVEEMVISARAAAAKANFVYPPSDAPAEPTAYTRVLELEGLDREGIDGAIERGTALRHEFAATLVRLGDEYWDAEGGRPFAIDYYAQAQLFAPVPPVVSARITLTPGELANLRDKASKGEFTEAELVAADPLAVLAQSDPTARAKAARRLGGGSERRASSTAQRIERLLGDTAASQPEVVASAPAPVVPSAAAPVAPTVAPADVEVPAPEEATVVERDPKRAAQECAAGEAALKAGRTDAAEAAFERAIGLDRRNPRALIGISDVHFDRGSYGKAAQYAAKAVAAAPTNAAYRVRLGDAYYKVHRYAEARDAYAKAVGLGDATAQARLDKVIAKLGE
jgi:tetratricopeptide (TPR) repeat protein